MGIGANSAGFRSIAISGSGIAHGAFTQDTEEYTTAIGTLSAAATERATATGSGANASAAHASAFCACSTASDAEATAVGRFSSASGLQSADADHSVALGNSSASALGLAALQIRYDDRSGKLPLGVGGGAKDTAPRLLAWGYTSLDQFWKANVTGGVARSSDAGVGAGVSFTLN